MAGPRTTIARRSPQGGGGAPVTLRPGELYTQITASGDAVVWVGNARGVPQPFNAGAVAPNKGVGGPKPNQPQDGQLWWDDVAEVLQIWSDAQTAWLNVFDDTDLLAKDGTRVVTGDIDFDGHKAENIALDAGAW